MDFKQITARANKMGFKILTLQMNPEKQVHSTVENRDMPDVFGVAMVEASKIVAASTGGKLNYHQVLLAFIKDAQSTALLIAKYEVDPDGEFTPEQMAKIEYIQAMTKTHADDGEDGAGENNA